MRSAIPIVLVAAGLLGGCDSEPSCPVADGTPNAGFHGSLGDMALTRPVVGMRPTRSGQGYLLVTSDGGVFALGDAPFAGSVAGTKLAQPIRAII